MLCKTCILLVNEKMINSIVYFNFNNTFVHPALYIDI